MDNASKALVMAGAILIAVMLISLGVLIFNRVQNSIEDTTDNLDTYNITTYNQRYTNYFGLDQSLSDVQNLVNLVNTHNSNTNELDQFSKISISASGIVDGNGIADNAYSVFGNQATRNGHYTIRQTKTGPKGEIKEIKISKNGTTSGGNNNNT